MLKITKNYLLHILLQRYLKEVFILFGMAYKRQVIILKGIDTNRENIPFGYILMEVLGNKLDLQIMFQMADINDDDNFYLIGVIKQREEFVPVKFISIKIKNKSVSQSFSTNAYNLFNSGIQIKDIFGFGIIKIKDKKQRLLLIGAFSDECLFQMERDIIKRLEMDHKNEKNGNKQIANKDSVQIKQIGFITNKEDAKDLSQEIFIKVYSLLKDYNLQYKFKSWLYKISVNYAIDFLRKKKSGRNISIDPEKIYAIEQKLVRDKECESISEIGEIYRLLEKLSNKYREVLLLKYIEGLDIVQIGEMLNINPVTVRVRLHRAIKILQQKL